MAAVSPLSKDQTQLSKHLSLDAAKNLRRCDQRVVSNLNQDRLRSERPARYDAKKVV